MVMRKYVFNFFVSLLFWLTFLLIIIDTSKTSDGIITYQDILISGLIFSFFGLISNFITESIFEMLDIKVI